jgi:hypothetical protein
VLRLTPDDYEQMQARINAAKPQPKIKARRNKYGAEPVEIDGRRFDSKAEGRRYLLLKDQERNGEISNLECQVSFTLIPEQIIAGKKERPARYVCDFRYLRDDLQVVEDVKSAPTKTREFIIKRKLMALIHGIEVIEVMVDD